MSSDLMQQSNIQTQGIRYSKENGPDKFVIQEEFHFILIIVLSSSVPKVFFSKRMPTACKISLAAFHIKQICCHIPPRANGYETGTELFIINVLLCDLTMLFQSHTIQHSDRPQNHKRMLAYSRC
jgi:hypothetical protein